MGTITRLPILRRPPRTPGHSFRIHRAERWLTQLVFFAVTTRTRPRVSHDKNKQKNSSVQSLNRFRSDFITTCSLSSLQYLIAWKTSVAMMDFFPTECTPVFLMLWEWLNSKQFKALSSSAIDKQHTCHILVRINICSSECVQKLNYAFCGCVSGSISELDKHVCYFEKVTYESVVSLSLFSRMKCTNVTGSVTSCSSSSVSWCQRKIDFVWYWWVQR